MLRDEADPAHLLGPATDRYVDSLYEAAESLWAPDTHTIDALADQVVPRITSAPAWPTLRAHLALLNANGVDPLGALRSAAHQRELGSADDPAAVLDWRLDDTGLRNAGHGPLPWVPAIPGALLTDDTWGTYLQARNDQVVHLSSQVRQRSEQERYLSGHVKVVLYPTQKHLPMLLCGERHAALPATICALPDRAASLKPLLTTKATAAPSQWQPSASPPGVGTLALQALPSIDSDPSPWC
ncbi:hypothetical protein [Ornithinimicrobium sp. INDO-MA30-4]|uniref:hypothetical protein n=1 Tax=Ornithinimicrobium sp. INDO-MA30-4 TaxID=2908651 RepID=UPI001F2C9E92|nr:hypothetical protein [Ornithinimicrobium sp. INDO-MA30-4]UJH71729.1 hypothetical protein L0A91_16730 [Ornithinimicrobium sp. INDO-MA30-4]